MKNKTIIIATKNQGKANEFKDIFQKFHYQVKTLLDYPDLNDVEETGSTFAENALQKARTIAEQLNTIVLADDSGLEVDALNGAPGIYSARYAGEHGNDSKNNEKLLKELEGTPQDERGANFHCTLALVHPDKEPLLVEGKVNGYILNEPRGNNGFGYDPLFFVPTEKKSMAELSSSRKNEISHRSKAIQKLESQLENWL